MRDLLGDLCLCVLESRLGHPLFFDQNNVIAELGLDRCFRIAAGFHGKGRIAEFRHHRATLEVPQIPTVRTGRAGRMFCGQFSEVGTTIKLFDQVLGRFFIFNQDVPCLDFFEGKAGLSFLCLIGCLHGVIGHRGFHGLSYRRFAQDIGGCVFDGGRDQWIIGERLALGILEHEFGIDQSFEERLEHHLERCLAILIGQSGVGTLQVRNGQILTIDCGNHRLGVFLRHRDNRQQRDRGDREPKIYSHDPRNFRVMKRPRDVGPAPKRLNWAAEPPASTLDPSPKPGCGLNPLTPISVQCFHQNRPSHTMNRRTALVALPLTATALITTANNATAATAAEINADADAALTRLYAKVPAAKEIADKAKGVLIFPSIIKGGFVVGGEYGEGALRQDGLTTAYYNIASVSYGLQIGAQGYSQVMMFMTDDALAYLDQSHGFEVGGDASVALASVGAGGALTSSTLQSPIIAFVFGQTGLMAGISIEGSKVTKLDK